MKSNRKIKSPAPKNRTSAGTVVPAAPPPAAAPPPPAPQDPPPGLDEARHAAAQRSAHGAEGLRAGVFPALMATALNLDKHFGAGAYLVYLAGVMRDMGDPKDPVERMLIEQLCLAHFRVAQLHAGAGQATGLEATKLLNTVTARMLGEMRRTALSLKAYRGSAVPTKSEKAQVRLFKAAQ